MDKFTSFQNLEKLYIKRKNSVTEIAKVLGFSENKINYWLAKYKIPKRTISEAIYIKHNPNGDPFKFTPPKTLKEAELFGMGLGLYWGEGNKANKNTVKIGNSDPNLLNIFIKFLVRFFKVKKRDLRFHLHVFTDIPIDAAINFWIKELKIKREQLYKPFVSITGSLGTYKKKSKYGVLTIYYANTKLRNILVDTLTRQDSSVG